ncbi:4-coumarate--CoA ligase, photoactive yellow protein activation family [Allochromatium warmingii]|uniref:4-coumarate--CoA ligase, photoactive yellow protein activation family n=1 Tax=Allochromatium warmingii TaxID=61595 RepID=A0A1H3CZ30_ALLWA|nr:4-coumarate--CoA ligase, photoactive yellow protein activation family [Allochromatium warmingii]
MSPVGWPSNGGADGRCRRLDAGVLKPWWNPNSVRALLLDLIEAELTRRRPGVQPDVAQRCVRNLECDDFDSLALDSLEWLDLATTVAVQFQLHETGHDAALIPSRQLSAWIESILESRAAHDQALGFFTSGSTGQPKLCVHQTAHLEQEIGFFATLLGDRRRILRAVPSHHIYGCLFAFMLPAQLGIPVLDIRTNLPGAILRQARPGDLVLGHPAFFDLATRAALTMQPDVVALTSTSPCPPLLWQRLAERGCTRLIEIYGSSETAGIGWREAADAPFALLPYWSRAADAPDALQRQPTVGVPQRVALPDAVAWCDERQLRVLKRHDGAVQIGGFKVYPERVQACIAQHPEVAAAQVRPYEIGADQRLKAFVVPSALCVDHTGLPARLNAWLADHLAPAERPKSITLGSSLPQSALGKAADWE